MTRFFQANGESGNERDTKQGTTHRKGEEFPNVVGTQNEPTTTDVNDKDGRVKYTRRELLEKFVEVEQPP